MQNSNANYEMYHNTNLNKSNKHKKKHLGLIIVLAVMILIGLLIGTFIWRSNVASNDLAILLGSQPFVFSDNDFASYVTGDIKLPQKVSIKDKEVEIRWKSDNPEIIDENGIVKRPSSQNEHVTLTAILWHGFGRGIVEYEFTVIKTDVVDANSVYVLSQEEIDKGIGNNNLVVTYDENNEIESIDGSFGITKVGSLEDALYIFDLYRPLLNVNDNIVFECGDVQRHAYGSTFTLQQVDNGYPIWGKTVVLTTDKNDNLDSINLDICRTVNVDFATLENNALDTIADAHFGYDVNIDNISSGIYERNGKFCFAYEFIVVSNTEGKYILSQVFVDAAKKEVFIVNDLTSSLGKMVDASGKNAFGNVEKFQSFKVLGSYELRDPSRNIHIIDGTERLIDKPGVWLIGRELAFINKSNGPVLHSNNNEWDTPQGVSAYKNLTTAYDWYLDNFNWKSFDGQGKIIKCVVNEPFMTDNACYVEFFDFFGVGPAKDFDYPPCAHLDVMAHEYTHGVFKYLTGGFKNKNDVTGGISEGYADIFGCLIEGNWQMGEKLSTYPLRDPSGTCSKLFGDAKYPETYFGANWDYSDGHVNSVLLSRAAYQMTQNGFSNDDVAKIWYLSMTYKYSDSSDYLDVRTNVEKAARKLGYSEEQLITIGDIFGDLGIGEKPSVIIANMAVDGDVFKDDVVEKRFLVVASPIGSLFGSPILIYEEDNGIEQTYTDEEMSKLLTDYAMKTIVGDEQIEDNEYFDVKFDIKVEYTRMPSSKMDIIQNFATEARGGLLGEVSKQSGQSEGEVGSWMNLFFLVQSFDGTSYDFWTQCIGIEFSQFER